MSLKFLAPVIKQRFFDIDGDPLVGGKVYTYAAGSTTPKATFTDESGAAANTNPIILDANGECDMWLHAGYYKIVLKDSADVLQWTVDRVSSTSAAESGASTPLTISNVRTGDWYAPAGSGAIKSEEFGMEVFKFPTVDESTVVINKLVKVPLSYAGGDIEVRIGAYTPSFSSNLTTQFPTFKLSLNAALIKKDAVAAGFRVDNFDTAEVQTIQSSCLPATAVGMVVTPGSPYVLRNLVMVFANNGTLDSQTVGPEDYLFLQISRVAPTIDGVVTIEDTENIRLVKDYMEVIFS